jgi:hypothetical protein
MHVYINSDQTLRVKKAPDWLFTLTRTKKSRMLLLFVNSNPDRRDKWLYVFHL